MESSGGTHGAVPGLSPRGGGGRASVSPAGHPQAPAEKERERERERKREILNAGYRKLRGIESYYPRSPVAVARPAPATHGIVVVTVVLLLRLGARGVLPQRPTFVEAG